MTSHYVCRRVTRVGTSVGAVALAAVLAFGPIAESAAAESKINTGFFTAAKRSLYYQGWQRLLDKIAAEGKGLVQVAKVSGPETISRQQWCNVVKNGIVQLAAFPVSWCGNLIPGSEVLNATLKPPLQQREAGAYDYMRDVFAKKTNTYFLAQMAWGAPFHFFTTKKISKLADIKGIRVRRSPGTRQLISELGADGVSMGLRQIYTAVERGVVDGFVLPFNFVAPARLNKVVKYRLDPGVYKPSVMILVNYRYWRKINDEQRAFLEKMGIFMETQVNDDFFKKNAAMGAKLLDGGIELVTLPEAEAKTIKELSQKVIWDAAVKKGSEFAAKLRPMVAN